MLQNDSFFTFILANTDLYISQITFATVCLDVNRRLRIMLFLECKS